MKNKVFLRKSGNYRGGKVYKWSPETFTKDKNNQTTNKYFCVTPKGGQGNDFKVKYTYVIVVVNGVAERHAYVQCDYVQ